jgi:Xaa-Pro aminopeptidase
MTTTLSTDPTTRPEHPSSTVDRLVDVVSQTGVDGIVLLSPQGFTYATGLRIVSHPLMRWRHAAALVGRDGIEGVMAIDMEELFVSDALPGTPLAVWKEFVEEPMDTLAGLIRRVWGTGPLTIGIELDFLPAGRMVMLERLLPGVTWVAIDSAVEHARARKTPSELDVVRSLSLSADRALLTALEATTAGDTEAELGERIISALYATGVSEHRFLIAASGTQTQYANAGPTGKVIEDGDLLRVEVFAGANGYQAGVARTAVMGAPSAEIEDHWAIVSGARTAGIELIRPGADPRAIYAAYTAALGPLSQHAIAFFGHGMGLDMHELPYISASSTDEIAEGAIIGVEPFAMIPGRFGFQVKDVVAVTADGYEMVSNLLDGGELYVVGA